MSSDRNSLLSQSFKISDSLPLAGSLCSAGRSQAAAEQQSAEQRSSRAGPAAPRRVALVLLTEAHVAVSVALRHAAVVHHEEVDLQVLCAGPLDLVVLRPDELHHLHTTPVARLQRRHCLLQHITRFQS